MSENEIKKVGALHSDIAIELHTVPAIQIWYGRKKTDEKAEIIGVIKAISYLRLINLAFKTDNPYAEFWLDNIEEKIQKINDLIDAENHNVKKLLKSVPEGFSFSKVSSVNPVSVNLFINIPIGYQLVFLLNKLDLLVRDIHLAKHISLLSNKKASDMQFNVITKLRSLLVYITRYKNINVTRKDFADDHNENVQNAIKLMGELPDKYMKATKEGETQNNDD